MIESLATSPLQVPADISLPFWGMAILGGLITGCVSWLIILTRTWHGRLSVDHTQGAQKVHAHSACRVGGVALLLGLWTLCLPGLEFSPAMQWCFVLGAALPVCLLGLYEDLSRKVSPRARLIGAFFSAGLFMGLTGVMLDRTGVKGLDTLLAWPWVAIAFTFFAVAGVTHAVNIIDGLHGLAFFTVAGILLSFAGMARSQLDHQMAQMLLATAVVLLGFGVFNWPWGRLFLGDGGAYLLGFLVAAFALLLVDRLPQVHPLALLLACFHPVFETLFSMWRRWHHAVAVSKPDRLHLHSLMLRRVVRPRLAPAHRHAANAITGLLCSLFTLIAALWAVFNASQPWAVMVGLACMVVLYLAIYARLVRFRWCTPWVMLVRPLRVRVERS